METQVTEAAKAPLKTAEDLYDKKDLQWIETVTGGKFYFRKPVFDIGEIAHALGMVCRYTGHCKRFYSVAEHSILVSNIMEHLKIGDPMEGLLHDATEAYLADIASPVKTMLKDYQLLEKALDGKMREQFKLPLIKTEGCIKADWMALFIEANTMMSSKAKDWAGPPGLREEALELPFQIRNYDPQWATSQFMDRMTDIRRRHRGLK